MLKRAVLRVPVLAILATVVFCSASSQNTTKSIWSKKGIAFPSICDRPISGASKSMGVGKPIEECTPLRIPSPDGKSEVAVTYAMPPDRPDAVEVLLTVSTDGKVVGRTEGLTGSYEDELVWSPDSNAFAINGGESSHPLERFHYFEVFFLDAPELGLQSVKEPVEQDMLRSFPPCKAAPPLEDCAQVGENNPDFAYVLAIDWIDGSSGLAVLAQLPCGPSLSGIACQSVGYELEARTGKILRRMEPKEFALRWQQSMAWKFHDPGPPRFLNKQSGT